MSPKAISARLPSIFEFNISNSLETEAFYREGQDTPRNGRFPNLDFKVLRKLAISPTKRIAMKTKSLLSCFERQKESKHQQAWSSELDEASSGSPHSIKSARVQEVETTHLRPPFAPSFPLINENKGGKNDVKVELMEEIPSGDDGDQNLIVKRKANPQRFRHKLPREEKRPKVENGTVKRLALLYAPHQVRHMLPREERRPAVEKGAVKRLALLYDVPLDYGQLRVESLTKRATPEKQDGRVRQDSKAKNISHAVHKAHLADGAPLEEPEKTPDCSTSPEKEEEMRQDSEGVEKLQDEGSEGALEGLGVVSSGPVLKRVRFQLPLENGNLSPASSLVSIGVVPNVPSDNDVAAKGEEPSLEDSQNKEELGDQASRAGASDEVFVSPGEAKDSAERKPGMMMMQFDFSSTEDYCTPILEFKLEDIGCPLM